MHSAVRVSMIVGAITLACMAGTYAQNTIGMIEGYYPAQLTPGQTTTMNIALHVGRGGGPTPMKGLEITPAEGITVGPMKNEPPQGEGIIWYTVPVTVAAGAAPGTRSLVAVKQDGTSTQPVAVRVPDHVLTISNLRVTSAPADGQTIEFQFSATVQGKGVIGDSPMAWFTLSCGLRPQSGLVRAKAANGVVTASIPNPKTVKGTFTPSFGPKCDLEVRGTDQGNVDSNTLTTTFEFK